MIPPTYHHGDLRRALLDATARLVQKEGAAKVSLRAVAREAGVSAAAPYHHFEDREAMLSEVAAEGFVRMEEGMEAAAAGSGAAEPLARLQSAGIAYVRFAVENPEVFRLMFGGLLSDRSRFPALQAAAASALAALRRLMGPRERMVEPNGLPPAVLAAWSTVHGLAFLAIEGRLDEESRAVGLDEVTRQVTLVLGRGLKSFVG